MSKNKNTVLPAATRQDFPIVGIGASAGGLDAFRQFLEVVPVDSGMAYVFVQHLLPSHESILPEILSRFTKIPVLEITDDIHLAPDHIYVIPENKILTSTDGVLKLAPRDRNGNSTIDIFFNSLAEVHLNLAVGVILSGMGSDGMLGLESVKKHGGFTFVQDPNEAEYSEMPQAVVNAQVADFVLPLAEIPMKIMEVMQNGVLFSERSEEEDKNDFNEVLSILRQHSGVDFTNYKQATIKRRIIRRMALSKTPTIHQYLHFLKSEHSATETLFNDLLIPVTSFFRDPKIFSEMKTVIFPTLVRRKTESKCIRMWSAGCSTGAEAYSLAIMLHEFLGENTNAIQIQVFATDISALSVAKARIGFYSHSELIGIPDFLLNKYFTKKNTGYQINRQIRDLCVFAVHNFLKDPPFAKIDFICCRNVLIYMDTFLQKKAFNTFHYALASDGFLLLGQSETAVQAEDFFTPISKSDKFYTRKSVTGRFIHQTMRTKISNSPLIGINTSKPEMLKTDFRRSADALLLSNYTPAYAIINEQLEVVHLSNGTAPFLELSAGKPTFNLLKIARAGLVFELRNAIRKSKESTELVRKEGIPIVLNGKKFMVSIEVAPLKDAAEPYFLVVFHHTAVQENSIIGAGTEVLSIEDSSQKRISLLEKELNQTRADVNSITEEQESFNEQLQSANEELMSNSEELQSLNEELETSKEELQSSNDELININEELLTKQDQINVSRNYTEAIVATLREPIVVLDIHLRIKNINRAFTAKYNITKEEATGKLIYEIQNHIFDNVAMRSMLENILPLKTRIDDYQIKINLKPFGESIMLLNARQLTNETSNEQLILLAIEDITERRIIEQRLQKLSDGFEDKVKERTLELETSVKELFKANIKLQQFAYITSHDLQEPLRKILMFISIIELKHKKTMDEDAFNLIRKIGNSSERMRTLIQDLLEYSYLNNEEVLFEPTDLNVVVENVLVDFELLIEEKKVTVTKTKLPVIQAIPLQINQLFFNLFSNALKFSRAGEQPAIEIASKILSKAQLQSHPTLSNTVSWCEITIKDNGTGFDEKYERQIFTIFKRLHNDETFTGTGIGLAISSKIVENHHGLIFAKSQVNKGSTFHVILPVQSLNTTKNILVK